MVECQGKSSSICGTFLSCNLPVHSQIHVWYVPICALNTINKSMLVVQASDTDKDTQQLVSLVRQQLHSCTVCVSETLDTLQAVASSLQHALQHHDVVKALSPDLAGVQFTAVLVSGAAVVTGAMKRAEQQARAVGSHVHNTISMLQVRRVLAYCMWRSTAICW